MCPLYVPYMSLICPYTSLTCPLYVPNHINSTSELDYAHHQEYDQSTHYASLICPLHVPYMSLICPCVSLICPYTSLTRPLYVPNHINSTSELDYAHHQEYQIKNIQDHPGADPASSWSDYVSLICPHMSSHVPYMSHGLTMCPEYVPYMPYICP